jgi:hypothetical protein
MEYRRANVKCALIFGVCAFVKQGKQTPMASGNHYIPRTDDELLLWTTQFLSALTPQSEHLGLTEAQVSALANARAAMESAVQAQQTAEAEVKAAVQAKFSSRDALESGVRAVVRQIQAHPHMTDPLRAQLNITVPKRTRTRRKVGDEIPGLVLETRPGQVIVHFGTQPGNEQRNGKPAWALGCNVYRKRGGETEFSLVAFDTASPYVDAVTGPAQDVSYRVAYRGTGAHDEGGHSFAQTIAAGG